jgi:hypothetical protein
MFRSTEHTHVPDYTAYNVPDYRAYQCSGLQNIPMFRTTDHTHLPDYKAYPCSLSFQTAPLDRIAKNEQRNLQIHHVHQSSPEHVTIMCNRKQNEPTDTAKI